MTNVKTAQGTQVYQVYIKASAQRVWDAITSPEWNDKYAYRCTSEYDLRPGGAYRAVANQDMRQMGLPETIIDGEVLEADPPHKLVQTFRFLFTPEQKDEGFTRLTYEITEKGAGVTCLTLVHDQLEGAPSLAEAISSEWQEGMGGGWSWILSDLKSLIETGEPLGN